MNAYWLPTLLLCLIPAAGFGVLFFSLGRWYEREANVIDRLAGWLYTWGER